MKKKFTFLMAALMLLTMMALPGKAVGQTTVSQTNFTSVNGTSLNNDNNVSYNSYQGGGTTSPAINSSCIRLYQKTGGGLGGYIVIGVSEGYVITSVSITPNATATAGYMLTNTSPGSSTPNVNSFVETNHSCSQNTAYTVNNISSRYVVFGNFSNTNSNSTRRLDIKTISVTYTSSGGGATTHSLFSSVAPVAAAGSVTLSATSVAEGETATATASPNTHYTFTSWSISGTGATLSSTTTNPTTVTMGTANATVTATFTEDTKYSITYNANYDGSSDEPVEDSDYAAEAMTIRPYNTFLRTGYEITSWNTAAGGGETSYKEGDSYTMTADLTLYAQWTKITTGTINFGSASGSTSINSASVTGDDNMGNEWTITTEGTTSFTQNSEFSQVGSKDYPATSITFTTTLASSATISAFSAKFGGFSGTAGTVTLKVGNTTVGTGSLNAGSDVTVSNTSTAAGTDLTVTVTNISKGVKCYYISYTPTTDPVISAQDKNLAYNATSGEIAYTISNQGENTVTAAEKTPGYDWIDNVTLVSAQNKVTFITTENAGPRREGYITITCGSETKDVKVTQAGPTYNVTYAANGGTGTMTDNNSPYEVGTEVTLLTNTFTAPSGYMWGSWHVTDDYSNEITVTNSKFTMPASDVTVTANWRGTATYTLVTSADDLVPGKHYILASTAEAGDAKAMSRQNGNIRLAVDVTVTETNGFIKIGEVSGIRELVLSGNGSDEWTLYDPEHPGFLCATSSSNNNIGTSENNSDGESKWAIEFDDDTNEFTFTAQGTQSRKTIRYNYNGGSTPRFSCYATNSSQPLIYLYVKDGDNDYNFYSTTTINDPAISATNTMTVKKGAKLTLTGDVSSCSNASWLVVEDGGQLVIQNAKTGVQATFQREVSSYSSTKDSYVLIANPTNDVINPAYVSNMIINEPNDVTKYDLYCFDESKTGVEWRNYKKETFNLVPGKGYLYAKEAGVTLNFEGAVPTRTTVPTESGINLEYTAANVSYGGFNLVGNPLSVNITSMYIDKVACPYYYLDNAGSFQTVAAADVETYPVKVGYGFMVQATGTGQKLTLNTDAKGFTDEVIRLEVSNDKYTDAAYISFGNSLPLTKINHLNDEAPMIYIHEANADKAVAVYNNRGEVKSVNVNFKAKTMGKYTISGQMVKGDVKYMHLYDRLTGLDTDLLESNYSFIGASDDITSRFILTFEESDNVSDNDIFAYQSGNNIMVNGEGELQIFDVMGRMVMNERINGVESISGLSRGIYIFRVIGETQKTQKIVVR